MRVDSGLPIPSGAEVERTYKKPVSRIGDTSTPEVTSELSDDAVRLSSLETEAMSTPDIRQDKVDALRREINAGTYQVSNESLADAILHGILKR
jgi:flagellar biosynthesis anti-sigma factor FlgM